MTNFEIELLTAIILNNAKCVEVNKSLIELVGGEYTVSYADALNDKLIFVIENHLKKFASEEEVNEFMEIIFPQIDSLDIIPLIENFEAKHSIPDFNKQEH